MVLSGETVYGPMAANNRVYDRFYAEYEGLHGYYGRCGDDILNMLKAIKREAKQQSEATKN